MGEITLRKALDDYRMVFMPYRNFAERTREEYLNDIEDLIRFIGHLGIQEVKDIGFSQLEWYLAELDHRGIASSTRKRKVVAIRSFLLFLYQDQYLSVNLSKQLIPPLAEPNSPRYLTGSECEQLLRAASTNPRDFALIQLLLETGIKLSELAQLTTNVVELNMGLSPAMKGVNHLYVAGSERRRGRIIRLNHKVVSTLDSYLKSNVQATGLALFANRFGKPLKPRGVEKIVKKYLNRVGIKNASVQALRHTFAIHQLAQGTDVDTLQKVMGFRDSRSISIYLQQFT